MLKLLANLKETWLSVISIVLLLVIQANADLALPDYTSRIVNIGIQQGGIENTAPEVLRKQTMEATLLFTQEKETILNQYTLLSKETLATQDYETYVKKYPKLKTEELYLRKELSQEELNKLNQSIAKPLMIVYSLSNEETGAPIKEQLLAQMPEQAKAMYQESSALEIIKQAMENQKAAGQNAMQEKLSGATAQIERMPESILEQAVITAVKEEYQQVGIDTDKYQNQYILKSGLQMLGVAFISMVTGITIMLLSARVAARLGRTLREKIFKKVLEFSTAEFKQFSTASLITRSTNDIQQIQSLLAILFRVVIYSPIIGFGGLFKVLTSNDQSMAWIIGLAILIILFIVMILFITAMPKFKRLQSLIDKLNLVSREILTGIPVIRAFHTEKREEKRFDEANTNLTKVYKFVSNAMNLMMPALMLVMNGISLLIIWVGGKNVDNGTLQVGDMMAFIQYTMQIVMAFLMISAISIMLPRASVSAKRINEVLDSKNSIQDQEHPKQFDLSKKGIVEFNHVTFRYPDAEEPLLQDISFVAKPGETTAIIGSTGSGKSTVVNLIPRFYDVTSGKILVDGIDIREVTQQDLRKVIGFVPQKGVLFSGTIESNIKYSDETMSDEQMKLAAEIAQATEFIENKPEKYDAPIAQGGNNVSGGQKQRLSIARAIAKDPEILVFDDSFSALDYKTDTKLRAAIAEKTKNKTVIIVAQRINTILHANQIIVLDEGKIVGKGTHEELMQNCEVYKQIALSQLSKEELE
ncbi:MAG: ABC transporter ATP-binding protein [Clostridia bacterium]|nr:ABC transporter ATP-binding protein [Clostridia bacterium]